MHVSKLKKYYFIDDFNPIHLKDLDKNITLIWRSKDKNDDKKTIYKLANFCKKNKISLVLSNNIKLALKLNLNGAYISSYNKDMRLNCFQYKKSFKLLGSAHNLLEVNVKKLQKVKEIFISPIFKYKKRTALGLHRCKYFFDDTSYDKIALGGVSLKNINLLLLTRFKGLGAIGFFKKKGPK
tara:strand:- start:663 stop:1208 length:546 start_codon:yes stop_codon:yes gene_type:complete